MNTPIIIPHDVPDEIIQYFNTLPSGEKLSALIRKILPIGDTLNTARQLHFDIEAVAKSLNNSRAGFTLKYKISETSQSPIRHSSLREKLGIPEQAGGVLSRDSIKIKAPKIKLGKIGAGKVRFDAAANYKDGSHNWGIHLNIKNKKGKITHAIIYLPEIGQIYVADKHGAHYITFPQFRSAAQNIQIGTIKIGNLNPKFNAEVGSWHTKERALIKALATIDAREKTGGSLRETGMKEAPFAWVGLNRLGYCFMGNMKNEDGQTGAFIARQAGASIIRAPITSDSQKRDILFAIHPSINSIILTHFNKAIQHGNGDVTIGKATVAKNIKPELVNF